MSEESWAAGLIPSSSSRSRRSDVRAELLSAPLWLQLPAGPIEARIRLSLFANGSRALLVTDLLGESLALPSAPIDPDEVLALLPARFWSREIVGIRPSALLDGTAHALEAAAILEDSGIEAPGLRHWVRLMAVDTARLIGLPGPPLGQLSPLALATAQAAVPPLWAQTVSAIGLAFHRVGHHLPPVDAMLAHALATGHFARTAPAPTPADPAQLRLRLADYLASAPQPADDLPIKT